jgi:hypothetical protein
MLYTRPAISDFGSISAHTFTTAGGETKNKEQLPGHFDNPTGLSQECSGLESGGGVAQCNID